MAWIKNVFMVGPENGPPLGSVGFGILQIQLIVSRLNYIPFRVGRA